jgi:chaperonin GroEL
MYTPKKISFDRDKLLRGLRTMSSAVESTLGPGGRPVIIESENHLRGITVTKDGVTVAKSINLQDAEENLAVRMMREASERTATEAGDGTTTAVVLTQALIDSYLGCEECLSRNPILFFRELEEQYDLAEKFLRAQSKRLTKSSLRQVATISANNDTELGGIIAKAYGEVGKGGLVTVENSDSHETYYEVTEGIRFSRGYRSSVFVNDAKRDECVLDDCRVFVSDVEVSNVLQIEGILRAAVKGGWRVLFVGSFSQQVMNTLAANVVRNGLKFCVVEPPEFGWKQKELMADLALVTGATYFSEETGDSFSSAGGEALGYAKKVIVGRDSTVIIRDEAHIDSGVISSRVDELNSAHRYAKTSNERDFLLKRIATLSGGIGVIYVGGNTDLEQKERYDRVDDAVCAVRAALEGGVLPGGGTSLYSASKCLTGLAGDCLARAMRTPLAKIVENVGQSLDDILPQMDLPNGIGYDAKALEPVNLHEAGILDPVKVTVSALRSAVTVATTILTSNAIITSAREYVKED